MDVLLAIRTMSVHLQSILIYMEKRKKQIYMNDLEDDYIQEAYRSLHEMDYKFRSYLRIYRNRKITDDEIKNMFETYHEAIAIYEKYKEQKIRGLKNPNNRPTGRKRGENTDDDIIGRLRYMFRDMDEMYTNFKRKKDDQERFVNNNPNYKFDDVDIEIMRVTKKTNSKLLSMMAKFHRWFEIYQEERTYSVLITMTDIYDKFTQTYQDFLVFYRNK